jgi:hypothetical protein
MSAAKISNNLVNDRHFYLMWSLADEKKLEQYTKRITSLDPASPEYSHLADCIIDFVKKRDHDHRFVDCELGHDWLKVSPINSPLLEGDMCTFQGINKLLKIYIATASGVFKWMARGTAAAAAHPWRTALQTETGSRQDCTTTGFQEVKGVSLRYFSTYASTVASATHHQMGLFDASTSGMMLALHDFGGIGQAHTLNTDSFSLGIIIDFNVAGDV